MKTDKYYKELDTSEYLRKLLFETRESFDEFEIEYLKKIEPNLAHCLPKGVTKSCLTWGKRGRDLWIHKLEEDYFLVSIPSSYFGLNKDKLFSCDGLEGVAHCLKNEYKGI